MSEPTIKRLGPYIIRGILGRGGMGSVFSAQHEKTLEPAAIKVLAPALASDDVFRERFFAEIDSLKTLNHPHIVKLHGYGEHDGHLYFAMELVEGTNLAQELQAGRRFNWREVTQLGIDISRALKHAHDHGVIHRDLKPANLLMDLHDQVKLTDFGIAKLFGNNHGTSNGSVLGTADYMAPEQAASEGITPRCDLFSLGCVMYALLTGRPPFRGKSIAEVVHKVRYEQPEPVTKFANDVPRDLQQILSELLEKNPDDRIRTALSLTHRLKAIQQALSISTTDREEFCSDAPHARPEARVNYVVNPPPDIAERPTVVLPDDEATSKPTAPQPKTTPDVWKKDHFTRVERDSWGSDSRNEFSSAIPLLLLLLTVVGGILGGIWYSSRPLSADDLYDKIMAAAKEENREALMKVRWDVNQFIQKHADDNRLETIKALNEDIAIYRIQRDLEVMARGRPETGSLSPIEFHCNEAFRAYRKGELATAIHILEGVQDFFGDEDDHSDIKVRRVLSLVNRLLPKWNEKLHNEIQGLQVNLDAQHARASSLAQTDPQQARKIWEGTLELYAGRPWATDHVARAREALALLDSAGAADTRVANNDPPETEAVQHE